MTNNDAYKSNPSLHELLNKQRKAFFLLLFAENTIEGINVGKPDVQHFCEYLERCTGCEYYWICHEDEISKETGILEKPHYHILVVCDTNKRYNTIIDYLCNFFTCSKFVQSDTEKGEDGEPKIILNPWIGIQDAGGVVSCVQYLIHLNKKDKKKYDVDDIRTNCEKKRDLYISLDKTCPIGFILPEIVEACQGSFSAMLRIYPADMFKPYMAMINTLIFEYNSCQRANKPFNSSISGYPQKAEGCK